VQLLLSTLHRISLSLSRVDLTHYVKLSSVDWVVRREVVIIHKVFRADIVYLQIVKPAEQCPKCDIEFTVGETRLCVNGVIRQPCRVGMLTVYRRTASTPLRMQPGTFRASLHHSSPANGQVRNPLGSERWNYFGASSKNSYSHPPRQTQT
jgi:hypothetical protein